MVIEAGRIVEQGTHEKLLAAQGRYSELYLTQFSQTNKTVDFEAS
ncbi:ABC transporter ATP-binding protein [Renibacterium salmoninarum ATCC 33209]|uniref:ABC transporter ATP-binding protein n=1 Tax=Renibacterium salmoninarum (strain ATCC 33209 / DSM 20767 / JCM 11484 / NBRC 15589 / NCIMB 2235) TaxID=288705 RepID=A9WVB6_RENSM|nr:ABC transporter ATP-binding protein [Renibacterium salmoninarum ATCC 33209]